MKCPLCGADYDPALDRCPNCGAMRVKREKHWTEKELLDGYRNSAGYVLAFFEKDGSIRYDIKNVRSPFLDTVTGILIRLALQLMLEHIRIKRTGGAV
ncbi:MAG: hypothetical protein ACXQTL_06150 [Methanosarcinales archaeon]